jgi:hypothetical protein
MADPGLTPTLVGTALATAVTYTLGPIFGELVVIVAMGAIGTLVALADQEGPEPGTPTWVAVRKSVVFFLKGVALSFTFSGIATKIAVSLISPDLGLTYYTMLGAVSFLIGWTSDKSSSVKSLVVTGVGNLIDKFSNR